MNQIRNQELAILKGLLMKFIQAENIFFKKGFIISIPLIAVMLTGCDSPEKRQFMTGCKIG